jgi:hypothetical protein
MRGWGEALALLAPRDDVADERERTGHDDSGDDRHGDGVAQLLIDEGAGGKEPNSNAHSDHCDGHPPVVLLAHGDDEAGGGAEGHHHDHSVADDLCYSVHSSFYFLGWVFRRLTKRNTAKNCAIYSTNTQ